MVSKYCLNCGQTFEPTAGGYVCVSCQQRFEEMRRRVQEVIEQRRRRHDYY